jgi:putative methyltransferase (TIGR04325 family)
MSRLSSLRQWLPPAVADGIDSVRARSTRFFGPMATWDDAVAASTGYDADEVLRRVLESSRKARDGLAAYERDSVLFDRIEHSFPVLATLLRSAVERAGSLTVLDFGGALGSSYRECRPFLGQSVGPLRWTIVEQPAIVQMGQAEFQTDELTFASSLSDAAGLGRPDVLLFSSVLQYLPAPHATVREALQTGPRFVVIDRTILSNQASDTLYVQRVGRHIYPASYPVWALSRTRLLNEFKEKYVLLSEHASLPFPALRRIGADFRGLILVAKDAP